MVLVAAEGCLEEGACLYDLQVREVTMFLYNASISKRVVLFRTEECHPSFSRARWHLDSKTVG